jgi:hypothetical protein
MDTIEGESDTFHIHENLYTIIRYSFILLEVLRGGCFKIAVCVKLVVNSKGKDSCTKSTRMTFPLLHLHWTKFS